MKALLALVLSLPLALAAGPSPLKDGQNAVAWQANKRFFFKQLNPVGVNTAATAELKALGKDSYQVRVEIPADKFDSGEAQRDKDVVLLLKGGVQPVLVFESVSQSGKAFAALRSGEGPLDGTLSLGGKGYPVSFKVFGDGKVVGGMTVVKLSDLDIKAPSAAAGMIMKVEDEIKLWFQFELSAIKGQEKVK